MVLEGFYCHFYLFQLLIATCNQYGLIFNILSPDTCFIYWRNLPYFSHLPSYLLQWAYSFLRSQTVLSYSRNSPHFKESEGSLSHLQVPATCHYPKPDQSSHISVTIQYYCNTECISKHTEIQVPLAKTSCLMVASLYLCLNMEPSPSFALCLVYSGQCS